MTDAWNESRKSVNMDEKQNSANRNNDQSRKSTQNDYTALSSKLMRNNDYSEPSKNQTEITILL